MDKHSPGCSYDHRIRRDSSGDFIISWTVWLRFPCNFARRTDESGAKLFAKKHGIEMPEATT